jgi:isoleucyl-tRNA synthetase
LELKPRELGPRIGSRVQEAIIAAKLDDWSENDLGVITLKTASGKIELKDNEWKKRVVIKKNLTAELLPKSGYVILDTIITDELADEGYARDLIRTIQDARKSEEFDVSDRILLKLDIPSINVKAVQNNKSIIEKETLSTITQIDASKTNAPLISIEKNNL